MSKYQNPQRIEEALEAAIDEFLKQMLTKYLPKVDRTVYRMDQTLKTIDQLTRIANDVDPYALEVFSKDLKLEDDSLLVMFLDKLFEESKDLNEELDKVSPNTQGYSTKYRIAYMKEDPMQYGKITPEITTKWESITKLCKKIAMLLGYMKETVEKVRDQRLLEK